MSEIDRVLSRAVLAATIINPRVLHRVLEARTAETPAERRRHLHAARAHLIELQTRLDMAELELAAAERIENERSAA